MGNNGQGEENPTQCQDTSQPQVVQQAEPLSNPGNNTYLSEQFMNIIKDGLLGLNNDHVLGKDPELHVRPTREAAQRVEQPLLRREVPSQQQDIDNQLAGYNPTAQPNLSEAESSNPRKRKINHVDTQVNPSEAESYIASIR